MKTYKGRAIAAIKILIEKRYRGGEWFWDDFEICPLCAIYLLCFYDISCSGCPNENRGFEKGCETHLTFRHADSLRTPENFKPRLEFWETALPILEKMPAWRFMPSKSKGFPELNILDKKIAKKYNIGI